MRQCARHEKDDLARGALGDHIYNHLLEAHQAAWREYTATVHSWELDRYLAAVKGLWFREVARWGIG